MRRTYGDLQKLGLSDTTKHLLNSEGSRPASHLDPSQYAVNERHTRSCSRCDTILMRPGVPRTIAALAWKREASSVEKAVCDIKNSVNRRCRGRGDGATDRKGAI